MNSFIKSVAVAAALVVPAVCFAQTAPQAAAAQNAAPDEYVQVVQYEEVDYVPAAAQTQPAMPAQPHQIKPADTSGVGGVAGASSQSGAAFNPNDNVGLNSIYQHN
ncbi:hypothetical protein [Paraburkholderia jirisanensis]